MKKSKSLQSKNSSTKQKKFKSLYLIIFLIIAAIFATIYSFSVNPPLIAGVLDDYKYNLSQKAAGVNSAGKEGSSEKAYNDKQGISDEQAQANAQATLQRIVEQEKQAAIDAGNEAAKVKAEKELKAIEDAHQLNPQNYQVSEEAKKKAEEKVAADDAAIAAAYAQINAKNTTGGKSCPGASSNIGAGQWAQTGGALKDEKGQNIPGSHACVQCGGGGDGVWGKTQVQCGEGAASVYIVRPDEYIDCNNDPNCKGKVKNNCWSDGAWYANSTSAGGMSCQDGQWKEYDIGQDKAKAEADALRDRMEACTNQAGHVYYNGNCYSSQETATAAQAYYERTNNTSGLTQQQVADAAAKAVEAQRLMKPYKTSDECKKALKSGETCVYGGKLSTGSVYNILPAKTVNGITTVKTQSMDGKAGTEERIFTTYTFGTSTQSSDNRNTGNSGQGSSNTGFQGSGNQDIQRSGDGSTPAAPAAGEATLPSIDKSGKYSSPETCRTAHPEDPDGCTSNFWSAFGDGKATYKYSSPEACRTAHPEDPEGCTSNFLSALGDGKATYKPSTTPQVTNKEITTTPTTTLSKAEQQEVLNNFNKLKSMGINVKTYTSCEGIEKCVPKIGGGVLNSDAYFIDADLIKDVVNDNKRSFTALETYNKIIDQHPRAFDELDEKDGGIAYFGLYTTKGNCSKQGWECIKIPDRWGYTYLNIEDIENTAEQYNISIPAQQ